MLLLLMKTSFVCLLFIGARKFSFIQACNCLIPVLTLTPTPIHLADTHALIYNQSIALY